MTVMTLNLEPGEWAGSGPAGPRGASTGLSPSPKWEYQRWKSIAGDAAGPLGRETEQGR